MRYLCSPPYLLKDNNIINKLTLWVYQTPCYPPAKSGNHACELVLYDHDPIPSKYRVSIDNTNTDTDTLNL